MKPLDYLLTVIMATSLFIGIVIQWAGIGATRDPWAYMKAPGSPAALPLEVDSPWSEGSRQ
jgi:hypothetical protein